MKCFTFEVTLKLLRSTKKRKTPINTALNKNGCPSCISFNVDQQYRNNVVCQTKMTSTNEFDCIVRPIQKFHQANLKLNLKPVMQTPNPNKDNRYITQQLSGH
uniref:Uncharacterized protein n=1 Tax=Spongospora subterranea TaxID=70186 RepID=A0A0H5R1F9_9EUKA|eukprot:CRZ01644.1 hypothetical protein [Spongospora subterranea]